MIFGPPCKQLVWAPGQGVTATTSSWWAPSALRAPAVVGPSLRYCDDARRGWSDNVIIIFKLSRCRGRFHNHRWNSHARVPRLVSVPVPAVAVRAAAGGGNNLEPCHRSPHGPVLVETRVSLSMLERSSPTAFNCIESRFDDEMKIFKTRQTIEVKESL